MPFAMEPPSMRPSARSGRSRECCDDGRSRRVALRRPRLDPGAARIGAQREVLADGSAAAHAPQQPRSRGRRAPGTARRLRGKRTRRAHPRSAQGHRADPPAARSRRDAARPERQARRRLQDARVGATRPARELPARPALGDLGRVPPAGGGGADDVRPDDGRQLDLHRHPGNPPGHVPDVRGGRENGTSARPI